MAESVLRPGFRFQDFIYFNGQPPHLVLFLTSCFLCYDTRNYVEMPSSQQGGGHHSSCPRGTTCGRTFDPLALYRQRSARRTNAAWCWWLVLCGLLCGPTHPPLVSVVSGVFVKPPPTLRWWLLPPVQRNAPLLMA